MSKVIAVLSLGILLVFARLEPAQVTDTTISPDSRAQRQATYIKLSREVFHTYDDEGSGRVPSLNKAVEIQSRLHQLLSDEIASILNLTKISAGDVVTGIDAVQGKTTDKPFADLFPLNGIKSLAVGYVIVRGDQAIPDTQPYLEFWDQASGSWAIKAEAPTRSDFRGHTFCVSQIDSGIAGEMWFLAWGMTIGNPGTPLDARLYSFDGYAVRTVWKREYLVRGRLTVSKGSVVLEYDREYQSADPYNRVREVLHVTPNGLE